MSDGTSGEGVILSTVLTAIAIAIGAGLGVGLGVTALLLYAIMLPVPLILLWLSSDVKTVADRFAPSERAAATAPPRPHPTADPSHAH